ncbi:adenine deaminase [Martelella alba]|uniref:Adenine deaminase n=1 Tax=Martelella alba TaxID=2590451 RepID=A0A506U9A2_9HYPH|nr:adenine deaminase C-terminal domain-containing protein [Martelella alba]TPW31022.1 adenine deaminase [Martelella alba]
MTDLHSEPADLNDDRLRSRAVAAARGDAPFDLLITGGSLVDVATGEIRAADIGLVGPLIASVHAPSARRDAADIVDATGSFIAPGLIDSHMHIESSMVTPATYAKAMLSRGVTTIVWDPHEFANVHGPAAVRWAIDAIRALPLRAIILAPSCVPSAPGLELAGADIDGKAMAEMLAWPEIGGIAEMMNMEDVIARHPRMSAIMQAGLAAGKPVFGHARGLEGGRLAAFMAAGVSSDHELTSAADFLEKLRAGLSVELRGSHPYLLPEIVDALKGLPNWPSTMTLATDDVFPDDLVREGGLDALIGKLTALGMKPEQALQAATLNAAHRLSRPDLGLIAAGRRADIVLFEDLTAFSARTVIANGTVVAANGKTLAACPDVKTELLTGSVKVPKLTPGDFKLKAEGSRVEIATIDKPRFTQWGKMEARVENGVIVKPDETTLISVIHRHGRAAAVPRTGFLRFWGRWNGALATTISHDSHNLTVFGGNEEDMAIAANALIEAGGGMAIASQGKLTALLALPLSGLVSDRPLEEVAHDFAALREAAGAVVEWQPPYLTFKATVGATLACNAGPHQTDQGISDVVAGTLLKDPVLRVL